MSYKEGALMNERSVSERADFLSRRRARILPILAVIYFAQQVTFVSALGNGAHRDVDHFKIGAWVVLPAPGARNERLLVTAKGSARSH